MPSSILLVASGICFGPLAGTAYATTGLALSGMSLWKYALAVTSGAIFRAGAFATLGEAVASGEGVLGVSLLMLAAGAAPLSIPCVRAWFFSVGGAVS